MKKTIIFVLSFVALMLGFSSKIGAAYEGNLGYTYSAASTNFWYVSDDSDVETIYLNVDTLESVEMQVYSSGVYFYTHGTDLKNKEYNYTVCKSGGCVDVLDPFARGINTTKDKNIILSNDVFEIEGWNGVSTLSTNLYETSIYAIEAQKFTENLVLVQNEEQPITDSIFARLSNPTKHGEEGSANTIVGYNYLERSGMKYVEIGNLYDDNNYFSPNQDFSSKTSHSSSIVELKQTIIGYKNIKMNVIARVDFLNVSDEMEENLKVFSDDYVVDGKINLNNSVMQRYILDVYSCWVKEYKVDGFYILDAQSYGIDFLNSLKSHLSTLNSSLLIYTDSSQLSDFYVSNELQETLFGSLFNSEKDGILAGNYTEENFSKLVDGLFGGYYQEYTNTQQAIRVINNIGSFQGLDLYSKIMLTSGLTTSDSVAYNKIRLGILTILASTGIPRLIAGNEYFSTNSIPTNEVDTVSSDKKVCIENTKWCYAIGDSKSMDWGYLIKNGSTLYNMMTYRVNYGHQYPSYYAMANNSGITYDKELAKSGILYLVINYTADNIGDRERSVLLANYSAEEVEIPNISNRDYSNYRALLGRVVGSEDIATVDRLTFFTFTEIKENKVPNWVYILVMFALLIIIFGIRFLCIKLLKTKKGIDYDQYSKEQRQMNKKTKRKDRVKEPSVFATYWGSDPLFKRKKKEASKEDNKEEKTEDENKKEES